MTTTPVTSAARAGSATDGAAGRPGQPAALDQRLEDLVAVTDRIQASVATVIEGKQEVVRTALTVLLAEGHLLIEDVPGVGKTMLAKALARSLDASMQRIQFTPDLLPGDVTGVSVFNQETRHFEFRAGAIFANIVLGDEINRASPKTQSALLECMEEQQVTVDGATYRLAAPFMVVATQNPLDMEGTYPLPEAQRDRFMARISMGYPSASAEMEMLEAHAGHEPLDAVAPVADADDVRRIVATVRDIHVAPAIRRYVVDLVTATRASAELRLGASPRATLHLVRAAKAAAALDGRPHVLPDDVQALAGPVLAHRLLVSADAAVARRSATDVVSDLLSRVPVSG